MTMQIFSGRGRNGESVNLPLSYRAHVKWLPHIGDIFPDFQAGTTEGPLHFHDWAEGHWCVLFSLPGAFTPVCTTEMAGLASAADEFAARDARLLGLSHDSITKLQAWNRDIRDLFGVDVGFPSVSDESGILSSAFGMIHPHQNVVCTIRKTFIIDPALRVRMILEYPTEVGRNTDELLRILDALRAAEELGVVTPADWEPGDDLLLMPGHDLESPEAAASYELVEPRSYLRVLRPLQAEVDPEDATPPAPAVA
ncbi:MAG: redoxin domain-containing protein [Rhodobacteraceae bacterium]|nr:redoxin domain-containing protein [Paracoccaceae bacterium]